MYVMVFYFYLLLIFHYFKFYKSFFLYYFINIGEYENIYSNIPLCILWAIQLNATNISSLADCNFFYFCHGILHSFDSNFHSVSY